MEFADLQELWVATSGYQDTMNVAITYGVNDKDLEDTKMRLEEAMKATDIAGIPEMLCKFDLYESKIYECTDNYLSNFNDFLNFIKQHKFDIWEIDNNIGEIEKFMKGVKDSLSEGKKALDEKGRTTLTPKDKKSALLAAAYIKGDFPSMTDEAFANELLKDCIFYSEKKRRVDYLLSQPLDFTDRQRNLMLKAIEEPEAAEPALTNLRSEERTECLKNNENESVGKEYINSFDLDGLKRVWEFCTTEKRNVIEIYQKMPTAGKKVAFSTSFPDFINAVNHADFSKIYEEKGTSKTNVKYLIYHLSKTAEEEWYSLAAKSINKLKGKCSGANVEESLKDKLEELYPCKQK